MSRDGVELFYTVEGAGSPVIMVHGGPGLDHTYLKDGFTPLSQSFQLIFYDQRCTGQSGGIPSQATITLNTFVNDLDALIRGFGLTRVNLLGHSWGALLALAYAETYPEKMQSLVLLNPVPVTAADLHLYSYLAVASRPPKDQEKLAALATSDSFLRGKQEAISEYLGLWFKTHFSDSEKSRKLVLRLSEKTASNLLKVSSFMQENLINFDLLMNAAKVVCPTLIVQGADDIVPLAFGQHLAEKLSHAERIVMENTGHFSFIENPDALFPAITTFLEKTNG